MHLYQYLDLLNEEIHSNNQDINRIDCRIPFLHVMKLLWPNSINDDVFGIYLKKENLNNEFSILVLMTQGKWHHFPLEGIYRGLNERNFFNSPYSAFEFIFKNITQFDKFFLEIIFKPIFIEKLIVDEENKKYEIQSAIEEALEDEQKKKNFLYSCIDSFIQKYSNDIDLYEITINKLKSNHGYDTLSNNEWDCLVKEYSSDSIIEDSYRHRIESTVYEIFESLDKTVRFSLWAKYFGMPNTLSELLEQGEIPDDFESLKLYDSYFLIEEVTRSVVGRLSMEADERRYKLQNNLLDD